METITFQIKAGNKSDRFFIDSLFRRFQIIEPYKHRKLNKTYEVDEYNSIIESVGILNANFSDEVYAGGVLTNKELLNSYLELLHPFVTSGKITTESKIYEYSKEGWK